MNVKG